MQIKALRGNFGSQGSIRRGQIIDVPDHQAQQMIKRGTFVPVQGEGAGKAAPGPSKAKGRSGGQSGKTKRSSSSPAGQASKASRSTKSEG